MAVQSASTKPEYKIDYEDERFKDVENEKNAALKEHNETYQGMIDSSDKFYQDQIDASTAWEEEQKKLQDEQTDFAIDKINQNRSETTSDYLKEQSGAYADWQKQSAQHGVDAEKKASSGMTGTGYSESSQVSMYNTYQNRVATARESYVRAMTDYDIAIKDAQLQNSAKKAEIAASALQQRLELALQGFQYKNDLILEQANKKLEIDNMYYSRWQDVLSQLNTEEQFNTEYDSQVAIMEKQQTNAIAQLNQEHKNNVALMNAEYKKKAEIINLQGKQDRATQLAKLEQERKTQIALLDKQLANEKALLDKKHAQELALLKTQYAQARAVSTSSSRSSGSKKSSGGTATISSKSYAVNTPYYKGSLNPDAKKYGTFSNGYQPKGISGHGKLSKSGDTIQIQTQTLSGHKGTLVQTVWKAADGTLWYWEGRKNKYIQLSGGKSTTKSF